MSRHHQNFVATYTPPYPAQTAYCIPTERLLRGLELGLLDELDLTADDFTRGQRLLQAYMNRTFRAILRHVQQYPGDRIHNAIFTGYCFGTNTGLAFHQALALDGFGKSVCPEYSPHMLIPRPRWPGFPSERFTLSRLSPGEVIYSRSFSGWDRSLHCMWRFLPGISTVVHMHCVECRVPI